MPPPQTDYHRPAEPLIGRGRTEAASAPSGGDFFVLVGWLLLCVGGGALIGILSNGGDSLWYATLRKPGWNPPSWLFAPVWTALYLLMAVAAWRVWRHGGWERRRPELSVFLAQLLANFSWSLFFFVAQRPALALADIAVLWLLIVVTAWGFARVDRPAAWLLLPYLVWVTYAATLNGAIVALN